MQLKFTSIGVLREQAAIWKSVSHRMEMTLSAFVRTAVLDYLGRHPELLDMSDQSKLVTIRIPKKAHARLRELAISNDVSIERTIVAFIRTHPKWKEGQ